MANFVRRHPDQAGVYQAFLREKGGVSEHIRIEGRELYSTDDAKEIALLRADEENIKEVNDQTKIELNSENE
jgi:hypothetical protein